MNSRMKRVALAAAALGGAAAFLGACQSMAKAPERPPLGLVSQVDLSRFMGDGYVIANIPTFVEKGAHAAKETYRLDADGGIDTTFTFRAHAFDGPEREYHSRGFVLAPSNAVWGQQYVWPFKADYRISYLAADYGQTMVTREKRDYVWIMARTPTMSEAICKSSSPSSASRATTRRSWSGYPSKPAAEPGSRAPPGPACGDADRRCSLRAHRVVQHVEEEAPAQNIAAASSHQSGEIASAA